jgi:chromosome segregation ATPase
MTLPEFAQLEEDNECLRAQLEDLENEKDDEIAALKAQINELKAQLHAKEEFATVHRQTEKRDGWVRGDDMKKLVALQIRDAREAGYKAVWDMLEDVPMKPFATAGSEGQWVPVWSIWRAVYAYQAATERALLGTDAPEPAA